MDLRENWGMNLTGRDLISDEKLAEWLDGWASRLESSIPELCSVSSTSLDDHVVQRGGPGGSKDSEEEKSTVLTLKSYSKIMASLTLHLLTSLWSQEYFHLFISDTDIDFYRRVVSSRDLTQYGFYRSVVDSTEKPTSEKPRRGMGLDFQRCIESKT